MFQRGAIAVLMLSSILSAYPAEARQQRETILRIINSEDRPIRAWIKPSGAENWSRQIVIAPNGRNGHFHIFGCYAIDVLVAREDDSFLYLPSVSLCCLLGKGDGGRPLHLLARQGHIVRMHGDKRLVFDAHCECAPSAKLRECREVATVKATGAQVLLADLRPKCGEFEPSCRCETSYGASKPAFPPQEPPIDDPYDPKKPKDPKEGPK
jgi:hypothetical protein